MQLTGTMSALKFMVFLGSSREGRIGGNVAKCVINKLQTLNHQVDVVDPKALGNEARDLPLYSVLDKAQAPQWMLSANQKIQEANAILVLTPEYFGTLPPSLTSAMFQFPTTSYRHKPCAIISYSVGQLGGSRAAFIARPFLSELGMVTIPQSCMISRALGKFTSDGECSDERIDEKLTQVLKELEWYGSALSAKMEATGPPE